jgi:CspA family cold shock protein
MPEGKIEWYDESRGYGLISPDKGDKDVVFRKDALLGFSLTPAAGDRVVYELVDPRRGTEAAAVRPD